VKEKRITDQGSQRDTGKLSIIEPHEPKMRNVSDNEINTVRSKYESLKGNYPEVIETPHIEELKSVAQYLFDPMKGRIEPETWDVIKEGTLYGYACYIHEATEIELRKTSNSRYVFHGGALYSQYQILKNLIKDLFGKDIDIVELCYNDEWTVETKNKCNRSVPPKSS